jgi:hypothetical protein
MAASASVFRFEPSDQYDQTLAANVHPSDWANPAPKRRYNLVVVGGGTAGLVTAAGAAGLGASVALVEKTLMGGDCLNFGCVPSKALIRAAHAAAEMRDADVYGIESVDVQVDFGRVMERMRRLRAELSAKDSARRFRDELGVDVFIGEARFTGVDAFEVDGQTLRFRKACIATGARAAVPPNPRSRQGRVSDQRNRRIVDGTSAPHRGAWCGANRMRTGADVSAVGRRGDTTRTRPSYPAARRRRGRAVGGAGNPARRSAAYDQGNGQRHRAPR